MFHLIFLVRRTGKKVEGTCVTQQNNVLELHHQGAKLWMLIKPLKTETYLLTLSSVFVARDNRLWREDRYDRQRIGFASTSIYIAGSETSPASFYSHVFPEPLLLPTAVRFIPLNLDRGLQCRRVNIRLAHRAHSKTSSRDARVCMGFGKATHRS